MTKHKRSKNSRMRGSKTHGGGSMKKRRGAGHRGGRGAAGSGKRGDAKKPSIWKNTKYSGKRGFSSHSRNDHTAVTICHLENHKKTLIKEGYLKEENGQWVINLSEAGYTKLLGTGKVSSVWSISAKSASEKAIEKIKNAKGSITILGSQNAEPAKVAAEASKEKNNEGTD